MRGLGSLLALPTSLVSLILLVQPALQEGIPPFNLDAHEKYFPEHEALLRRNWDIEQKFVRQKPDGLRKMSEDEGEKFFLEYWSFESITSTSDEEPTMRGRSDSEHFRNETQSGPLALLPAFPLHANTTHMKSIWPQILGRNIFERDFQCPGGTSNCASIGQPNSCCQYGASCINVQDTGLGSVGCCPSGQSCSGSVSSCNTAQGYSSCPGSSNGGCCIPGYSCQDVGCILVGTQITTTTLPVATVTAGTTISNIPASTYSTTTMTEVMTAASVPNPLSVQTVTTTIIVYPSTSAAATTVIQTMTVTPSTNPAPSSTLIVQGQQSCTTGYQTCPSSLGGGCCPTDRACGSPTCPPMSSTGTAAAPVRPTSVSDSAVTGATTTTLIASSAATTSTAAGSVCPTGFYMCSAYYQGGCCRVGRNCDTTSCPSSASTSVIDTSGLTVVAPVATITSTTTPGSGASQSQGTCANGWFSCDANAGGGCCPSGYVCGTSCSATISGQSNVSKQSSSQAARAMAWSFFVLGAAAGGAMIVL